MVIVLIQKAFGKGYFTQKVSPMDTMYAEVNPANTITILKMAMYTRFFFNFSRCSVLNSFV